LDEPSLQALPMPAVESGDGGMVDLLTGGDDPGTDIILAGRFDLPGRTDPLAVAVEHQRQHHLGWVGRRTLAIGPITGQEPGQIELSGRVYHPPAQMIGG
jgi:hypothetical protein